ncbi:hypothetical protein ASPZODRAFT_297366 [Penicilliopsis zonata CBS 506.65]|uniref:Uncharacterized protein n=1 Tax=Penicilliopsis zonata CBS 506.65 TaxID=1073090 RepID=A0A1L9SUT0_9EURO|nr:hypothetical protein ASPZODRAFT_297366 [Penicilliopsis zonata CBS 506.65]OJJ50958.1 hypothetical protein ASPZODRAFT_297366 [Penicilliopsis zonata CBS 506.65]
MDPRKVWQVPRLSCIWSSIVSGVLSRSENTSDKAHGVIRDTGLRSWRAQGQRPSKSREELDRERRRRGRQRRRHASYDCLSRPLLVVPLINIVVPRSSPQDIFIRSRQENR